LSSIRFPMKGNSQATKSPESVGTSTQTVQGPHTTPEKILGGSSVDPSNRLKQMNCPDTSLRMIHIFQFSINSSSE
jgi:hypothetical protein